jgi:hypothetical protein
LPIREKFDREKFDREKFETEYTRIRAERRARNDEALQELREKNWPRLLKYLAVGAMRVLMLRNEGHHAGGDAVRAIRQVACKEKNKRQIKLRPVEIKRNQMTKIQMNKMDVARRQLDAAIRMTFGGEDPIAVHSVAAAGYQIIRDICKRRGDIDGYNHLIDWISPGQQRQFWQAINRSANFFKHADRDANAIHEMNEEETDSLIVVA